MRADMFKVIERPRWGSRHAPPVKRKKDKNDLKQIGVKRHVRERADYSKSLNENLAPLVRFLQRRIGRNWDGVFAEICEHLDTGSTVKMHVREHLRDFVIFGGRRGELLRDGHVLSPDRRNCRGHELYVDPRDGILKDRVWFWRDQGHVVPPGKRHLGWKDAVR